MESDGNLAAQLQNELTSKGNRKASRLVCRKKHFFSKIYTIRAV
jgi:hypothetical protein